MKRFALALGAALVGAAPALAFEAATPSISVAPWGNGTVGSPVAEPNHGGWPGRPKDFVCGADELLHFIGGPVETLRRDPGASHARFLYVGIPSDTMYNLNRLNVVMTGDAGEETVYRIYCG